MGTNIKILFLKVLFVVVFGLFSFGFWLTIIHLHNIDLFQNFIRIREYYISQGIDFPFYENSLINKIEITRETYQNEVERIKFSLTLLILFLIISSISLYFLTEKISMLIISVISIIPFLNFSLNKNFLSEIKFVDDNINFKASYLFFFYGTITFLVFCFAYFLIVYRLILDEYYKEMRSKFIITI